MLDLFTPGWKGDPEPQVAEGNSGLQATSSSAHTHITTGLGPLRWPWPLRTGGTLALACRYQGGGSRHS